MPVQRHIWYKLQRGKGRATAYIDECPIKEISNKDQGLRKSLWIICQSSSRKVNLDDGTIPFTTHPALCDLRERLTIAQTNGRNLFHQRIPRFWISEERGRARKGHTLTKSWRLCNTVHTWQAVFPKMRSAISPYVFSGWHKELRRTKSLHKMSPV